MLYRLSWCWNVFKPQLASLISCVHTDLIIASTEILPSPAPGLTDWLYCQLRHGWVAQNILQNSITRFFGIAIRIPIARNEPTANMSQNEAATAIAVHAKGSRLGMLKILERNLQSCTMTDRLFMKGLEGQGL